MSETALVPFRVEPDASIEPIDPESVPDPVGSELKVVQRESWKIRESLDKIREDHFNRHMKKVFPLALATLVSADIGCAIAGVISVGWFVGMLFVAALCALFAALISSDFRKVPETEEMLAMQARRGALVRREERLHSLERLTGQHDQALKLLQEVESFNLDIASLDLKECTSADQAMIAARRREIARRIGAFRQKVLDDPNKPLGLLPESTA